MGGVYIAQIRTSFITELAFSQKVVGYYFSCFFLNALFKERIFIKIFPLVQADISGFTCFQEGNWENVILTLQNSH